MGKIEFQVVAGAPVSRVWDVVSDVRSWHDWSHSFWFALGTPRVGTFGALMAQLHPAIPLPAPIPVRFDVVEPNRELCWSGGIPGVGTGSHYIRLEPTGDGHTRIIHGEVFGGPAVRLVWGVVGERLKPIYKLFTKELAKAVG